MRILTRPVIFFLSLILALALACSEESPSAGTPDLGEANEKLDSVGRWLANPDNYLKDNYYSVFFQYYTPQLKEKKLDSAAHLLTLGLNAAGDNYRFDSLLVQVATSLMQNHERDLAGQYSFNIYYALGDLYSNNELFDTSLLYLQRAAPYLNTLKVRKDHWEAHLNVAMEFVYMNLSNLDSAMQCTHTALK